MKMDLKLGGKYRLGNKLNARVFGEVFIAKDNTTREDVTVKIDDNRIRHP